MPSFWHPDDGSVRPCPVYQTGDGFTRLTVELPPTYSVFVVFREEKSDDHLVAVTEATPASDSTAIRILSHEQDTVTAKVWRPDKWRVVSARGGSGELAVGEVTPDQPIAGPWQVKFPENLGAPSDIIMEALGDWTAHENPGPGSRRPHQPERQIQREVPLAVVRTARPGELALSGHGHF